jgi:hypothetical protein
MCKPRSPRYAQSGWLNSPNVCGLSDETRHLGHIVLECGQWVAWDATHLNEEQNGFKHLGRFLHAIDAKAAVEAAVSFPVQRFTMTA